MPEIIHVPTADIVATMPAWVKDYPPLYRLFLSSLAWRCEMFDAEGDADAQDRLRALAREADIATATITLADAERRWRKTNLRQNAQGRLFMWRAADGVGPWLTTTYAMVAVFGPEPVS